MDVTPARDPRSPLAVVIHGGAWVEGSRSDGDIQQMAKAFQDKGFATASLGYRLSSEARFPAQVDDAKTALRWLHAHAAELNADPSRIVVIGASAGGWIGSMLGATNGQGDPKGTSSTVNAIISLYGPSNFGTMNQQGAQIPGSQDHNGAQAMEGLLLGKAVPTAPDLVKRANPTAYLSGNKSLPRHWLLVHGTADKTVPAGQSQELADALTAAGITPKLDMRQGLDHADPAIRDDHATYTDWATQALSVASIQPVPGPDAAATVTPTP